MTRSAISIGIVDDDASVRRSLFRLLLASGHMPSTYASGPAFLASLDAGLPDCLVTDLHLPGMSGFDLHRTLLASGYRIPTILITGFDEASNAEKCRAAGIAAYLVKPVPLDRLLAAITEVLSHRARLAGPLID
jgi:FixJ family two-component response regulator